MKTNRITLIAFAVVILAQLAIPAQMILGRESTIKKGTTYKFKTAPIDPHDPFRGKYITLNYSNNSLKVEKDEVWERDETIYVVFENDENGYAVIKSASKTKPTETHVYLKTTVDYFIKRNNLKDSNTVTINYPFDRFYMEESKAYEAEQAYREAQAEDISFERDTAYLHSSWSSFLEQTNEVYNELQDSSLSIELYSLKLTEYKDLIIYNNEVYEYNLNLEDLTISELNSVQEAINNFDFNAVVDDVETQEIATASAETYALVSIINGNAVLKNVMIDEVPIKDVVTFNRAKEEVELETP